jgi:hypothetical protein
MRRKNLLQIRGKTAALPSVLPVNFWKLNRAISRTKINWKLHNMMPLLTVKLNERTPRFFPLAAMSALLFAALVSCASAPQQTVSAPRPIPADFAGVVHGGGSRTQKEFAYLEHLGVKWILHTFYWSDIEPEKGDWDFLYYDDLVKKANAAGIQVLGVLGYDTWWIHADKSAHRYIPPEKIPDFLEYVRQTVSRYRGKVGTWCIWNEPNFAFWNGTDEEFFDLARQTAEAARETDPEATLLGGAFNRGVLGIPEKFIRGLFESGAMDAVDAVAFHPYELNPARTAQLYEQFRSIVDDYGFGKKIWITEVGYPTGGLYPTKVSEKKLGEYVIKTFTLLAAQDAEKLLWYQLFDPVSRKKSNSEDFFGLVRSRRDYQSKGAEAFRLCAAYLSGTVLDSQKIRRKGVPDSLESFYFESEEGGALVLWNKGSAVKIRIQLPAGSGHLRHDPVRGTASPIPAESVLKAGNMPVFITWQGGAGELCQITKP